jgi:hypothetical protein
VAYAVAGLLVGVLATRMASQITALGAPPRIAALVPAAHLAMVIVPGVHLGPDGKMHDAFIPTDIAALVGQRVIVTIYNYDRGRHSITASALHLNVLLPAARRAGVPSVTVFTLRVGKAGVYHWRCMQPCDDMATGWAMLHDGYMAGTITIRPA